MSTNFEMEVRKPNVVTNGSNTSLIDLVERNQKAMHGMASRFGDVNTLKEQLEQVLNLFENQREVLAKEVGVICEKMVETEESTGKKLVALKDAVVIDYESIEKCRAALVGEIKEIKQMKRELSKQMEEVEKAINKRIRKQRYLWSGVGVLVISLVVCLGYMCNELSQVVGEVKELRTNVNVSMTEVKGAVLIKEMNKVNQEKAAMEGKGKKR